MPGRRFSTRLLQWYRRHGRKDLPWQHPRSAYRVWVSEIMLQQTQVATVIPYFKRFIKRFPGIKALARADLDEVLEYWSGLGYYARARNLHKAARIIVERHGGRFPRDIDAVEALPGIGRSTAGAILAQAFGQRHAILDGNVKRVLARYCGVEGWPGSTAVSRRLWEYSEQLTPDRDPADYTQAIMDLGSMVCTRTRPACRLCPVNSDCHAYHANRTAELPSPRPRKTVPLRRVQMIMLVDPEQGVLLERRPPSGIWGGLLSFPELDPERDAGRWCRRHLGRAEPVKTLEPVRHTFSHFRLEITPRLFRLREPAAVADGGHWVWYRPGVSTGGLAAPVEKLIRRLQADSGQRSLVLGVEV